jgi:hypothetical protein
LYAGGVAARDHCQPVPVGCRDPRVVDRLAGGVQDHPNVARSLVRTGSDFILSLVGAGKRYCRTEQRDEESEADDHRARF